MPNLQSDAALWYNVGVFGELGYAVPNMSDDFFSLNPTINEFVASAGAQLFAIMHHPDADMRVPPRLRTLQRIHRLYLSTTRLLAGRMVKHGERDMEAQHVQVNGQVFLVFPCPYFRVHNTYLKRWAGYTMMMMADAMQHTENRYPLEISERFAGQMAEYVKRIYTEMSVELFGKLKEEVQDPTFLLQEEDFKKYNPDEAFPGTESMNTVPALHHIKTEDQLDILRNGIPVTELPNLQPWPTNMTAYYEMLRGNAGGVSHAAVQQAGSETGGQDDKTPHVENSGQGSGTTGGSAAKRETAPFIPPAP